VGQSRFREHFDHSGDRSAFDLLDIRDAPVRNLLHDVEYQHFATWCRRELQILQRLLTDDVVGRDESNNCLPLTMHCEGGTHAGVFHVLQSFIDRGGF
jgi:hypothetical protein